LNLILNLNAFVSGSVSLNCVGHSSLHYQRVNGGGNELGKFGVEHLDKEQNEVCENSLNNYPLKKFHLGFIHRVPPSFGISNLFNRNDSLYLSFNNHNTIYI